MLNHLKDTIITHVGKSLYLLWIGHASYVTVKITLQQGGSSLGNWFRTWGKENLQVSNVLFFPDRKQTCPTFLKNKKCSAEDCLFGHSETSLWKLLSTLDSSITSLDICVFTITSQDLADIIIKKHKQGIVIRVITDCEKMDLNCSQIEQMRASGIQVRHDKTSYFMHHKFTIVDSKILINGSFNWTRQAITGNQENLLISNDKQFVKLYSEQFQKLWKLYKPGNSI